MVREFISRVLQVRDPKKVDKTPSYTVCSDTSPFTVHPVTQACDKLDSHQCTLILTSRFPDPRHNYCVVNSYRYRAYYSYGSSIFLSLPSEFELVTVLLTINHRVYNPELIHFMLIYRNRNMYMVGCIGQPPDFEDTIVLYV